jgi:2-dehydro-3-deoxy-D-arabinonate dehydratase
MMKLYQTVAGPVVEIERKFYRVGADDFDALLNRNDLIEFLLAQARMEQVTVQPSQLLPPIGSQEVWASGVTYEVSREARFEEAKEADGGIFYRRVYNAERPELFFKANAFRVIGPGGTIRVRRDASWSVPEPEFVVVANREAEIVAYTIGNDVSSRDIEGENPLYLPQAKTYNGSCALGPALLVSREPLPDSAEIELRIERSGQTAFRGTTSLARLRRSFLDLVSYLYRELDFPVGAYLLTGTGIVPPDQFTLSSGDVVRISVPEIGELVNQVE